MKANNIPVWIGHPHPVKWAYKKDIPTQFRHEAYRIDFGLFGVGYVARDVSGYVLMKSGQRMPTVDFYLRTPGHVIGFRDAQTAAHMPWAFEWQTAFSDRAMDQVNLSSAVGGLH